MGRFSYVYWPPAFLRFLNAMSFSRYIAIIETPLQCFFNVDLSSQFYLQLLLTMCLPLIGVSFCVLVAVCVRLLGPRTELDWSTYLVSSAMFDVIIWMFLLLCRQ